MCVCVCFFFLFVCFHQTHKPDVVLYDAGCDVHENDALGYLNVTDAGLRKRELLVFDTCLARGVPVAGFVGGGYDADLDVLAARHAVMHHAAKEIFERRRL